MSTTLEVPCQLALDFEAPIKEQAESVPAESNVVRVEFGARNVTALERFSGDHAAIVKQVLLSAQRLSW